jgi:VanZ family protein
VRTVVLSAHEEHFLAYLVTAAMLAWLTTSAGVLRTAAALTAYAAILELGQYAIPGRDPALADFCASTLGVLTGVAAVWLARRANGRQAQLA